MFLLHKKQHQTENTPHPHLFSLDLEPTPSLVDLTSLIYFFQIERTNKACKSDRLLNTWRKKTALTAWTQKWNTQNHFHFLTFARFHYFRRKCILWDNEQKQDMEIQIPSDYIHWWEATGVTNVHTLFSRCKLVSARKMKAKIAIPPPPSTHPISFSLFVVVLTWHSCCVVQFTELGNPLEQPFSTFDPGGTLWIIFRFQEIPE